MLKDSIRYRVYDFHLSCLSLQSYVINTELDCLQEYNQNLLTIFVAESLGMCARWVSVSQHC